MKEILTAWHWDGSVSEPVPYGEGHINQTYAITVTSEQGAKRYILQKINTNTFKDPAGLMENVCGVTDFLREKAKQRGADPARATLHVVPTKEEKPYYQAADGSCWRIYEFVENTVCLQQDIEVQERQIENLEQFIQRAHKYKDLDELTPYALRELVKGVYIEAPNKSSGKRRQNIRISYDLVGFIPLNELMKEETA